MFCWLNGPFDGYTVTSWDEAPEHAKPLTFWDTYFTESFVASLAQGSSSQTTLEWIFYDRCGGWNGHGYRYMVERLAREILSGSILVFRGKLDWPHRRAFLGSLEPAPVEEKAAPADGPAKQSFFAFKVVDDETSDPVAGARVEVELEDGSKNIFTTGADGLVELKGLEQGSNSLSCPLGGLKLKNTLEFVAIGESPSGSKGGKAKPKGPGKTTKREVAIADRPPRSIARIKAHKVRKGDTLEKIASDNSLTHHELTYFNWGVYSAPEVEERLRDEVGCLQRDDQGRCVFDDEDEPGIVIIPERWTADKLATDKRHTVRVRPAAPVLPDLRFHYQIDPDEPEAKNDTITLETEDGSWSHELPVSALFEVEPHWVELVFPEPPAGARFNLIQDPKDGEEPFYVFKGVSYGELREAHAEQVAEDKKAAS